MKRLWLSLLSSVLLASLPFGIASAEKAKKDNIDERIAYVNEQIKKLGKSGPDAVDKWLLQNGFEKVKIEKKTQGVEPLSSNGNVDLWVDAYYDTLTKAYCIKGSWEWKDEQFPDSEAGPEEVLALIMSDSEGNPLSGQQWKDGEVAVYDQEGNYYDYLGGLSDWTKSAHMFTFQDEWYSGGLYAGYSGHAWAWMTQKPSASTVYLTFSFQHTYEDGELDDVSINWGWPPSINTTWNDKPKQWTAKEYDYFTTWRRD